MKAYANLAMKRHAQQFERSSISHARGLSEARKENQRAVGLLKAGNRPISYKAEFPRYVERIAEAMGLPR
jgi:hypothetical protein